MNDWAYLSTHLSIATSTTNGGMCHFHSFCSTLSSTSCSCAFWLGSLSPSLDQAQRTSSVRHIIMDSVIEHRLYACVCMHVSLMSMGHCWPAESCGVHMYHLIGPRNSSDAPPLDSEGTCIQCEHTVTVYIHVCMATSWTVMHVHLYM